MPLSQQLFVDCTIGFGVGNGTRFDRTNKGCVDGLADLHLIWLNETQSRLLTEPQYRLEPNRKAKPSEQCRKNADQLGFGPNFYNNRQTQVYI